MKNAYKAEHIIADRSEKNPVFIISGRTWPGGWGKSEDFNEAMRLARFKGGVSIGDPVMITTADAKAYMNEMGGLNRTTRGRIWHATMTARGIKNIELIEEAAE